MEWHGLYYEQVNSYLYYSMTGETKSMPRVKNIPVGKDEETETLVGMVGLSVGQGNQWVVAHMNVGKETRHIYEYVPLEDTENHKNIEYKSKTSAQAFIDGYNYALSELGEAVENAG